MENKKLLEHKFGKKIPNWKRVKYTSVRQIRTQRRLWHRKQINGLMNKEEVRILMT